MVNGTHFVSSSHWKIPRKSGKSKKVGPFSRVGISKRNFVFFIDSFLVVCTSLYQVHGRVPRCTGVYDQMEQVFTNRKFHFCSHWNFQVFSLNGKCPPCQSPLVSNNLQKVTTYPKHQNAPSQSLADWTSHKQPPPVRLQPLLGADGFVISLCFILLSSAF